MGKFFGQHENMRQKYPYPHHRRSLEHLRREGGGGWPGSQE